MKKLTCIELGGACDAIIAGATPEEMGENAKRHGMEMLKQGDAAHREAMMKMGSMSGEDMKAFWADFQKKFAEAEEA
jgi:hypothetical protein